MSVFMPWLNTDCATPCLLSPPSRPLFPPLPPPPPSLLSHTSSLLCLSPGHQSAKQAPGGRAIGESCCSKVCRCRRAVPETCLEARALERERASERERERARARERVLLGTTWSMWRHSLQLTRAENVCSRQCNAPAAPGVAKEERVFAVQTSQYSGLGTGFEV